MLPGRTYHLYTHANGSENLFRCDENFRYFLKRYEEFTGRVADTLAWCLMPNHLHLLVKIKSEAELVGFFKSKNLVKDLTGLFRDGHQDLSGLEAELELQRLTILQFSHLLNAYTKAYNKVYQRKGSLFTRAFKRKEITTDSYFTSIIHYIHHNPAHHGFVEKIESWPWSSYHALLSQSLSPIQQEVIDWFGNRKQFIEFHQQAAQPLPEIDHD